MQSGNKKLSLSLASLILIPFMWIAPVAAESGYHTVEFLLQPGKTAEFLDVMEVALVDTRNFKGCEHIAVLVDQEDPQKVVFYEIWESEEDHAAYQAWRAETDFGSTVQHLLAGPPARRAYTLSPQ
jgi:quinol monooxygenase YgiN